LEEKDMKRFKKIVALITASVLALTSLSLTALAEGDDTALTDDAIRASVEFKGEKYESDIVLKYLPSSSENDESPSNLRGVFPSSDYIYKEETLTSSDAVDFYPFSVTGTRSIIFRLVSDNSNYVAIVCPYDPTTGDITLNGYYVNAGEVKVYGDFNSNSQNNYCVVVLNQGAATGDAYALALNAQSTGYPDEFVNADGALEYVLYRYGTNYLLNGNNIITALQNYISNNFSNTSSQVFERENIPEQSGGNYYIMWAKVNSLLSAIGHTVEYGTYYSSGLGFFAHAIRIPVSGQSYACYWSTNLVPGTLTTGTPDGYLIYDLVSDTIVDWDSDNNVFYISGQGNETRTFTTILTLTY